MSGRTTWAVSAVRRTPAERRLRQLFVEPDLAEGLRGARYVVILNLPGTAASEMSLMLLPGD